MHEAALVWRPDLADYDLGEAHPLDPVRLTLSVELMRDYGILPGDAVMACEPVTDSDLALVHDLAYIETVREASDWASAFRPRMGLGTADNPIFPGMHDVSALVCGSSAAALAAVLDGRLERSFAIAGGLHHAHRDRAAGFCVYNDPAVAIALARRERPGLRVLYVDIDAHHGDGVQETFYDSPEVMTISLHENGAFLFPGTGFPHETGTGAGTGFSANVPLPPWATDACYALAFSEVVEPLARAFAPDVIVAQLGVDAHHDDPLTQLGMTLPGYRSLVRRLVSLAGDTCGGKLCALGGGGYAVRSTVPCAWAWVMAELRGVHLDEDLPDAWRGHVGRLAAGEPPRTLGGDDVFELPRERAESVLADTAAAVAETRGAVFPHLGLKP
jgi:acetoin utilization protein AcuC